jgi:hypothetical protein
LGRIVKRHPESFLETNGHLVIEDDAQNGRTMWMLIAPLAW